MPCAAHLLPRQAPNVPQGESHGPRSPAPARGRRGGALLPVTTTTTSRPLIPKRRFLTRVGRSGQWVELEGRGFRRCFSRQHTDHSGLGSQAISARRRRAKTRNLAFLPPCGKCGGGYTGACLAFPQRMKTNSEDGGSDGSCCCCCCYWRAGEAAAVKRRQADPSSSRGRGQGRWPVKERGLFLQA